MSKGQKKKKQVVETKPKIKFMDWARQSAPSWHVAFGVLSIAAGIYCVFKPDIFNFENEFSHIVSVIVFIALGVYLVVEGLKKLEEKKKAK